MYYDCFTGSKTKIGSFINVLLSKKIANIIKSLKPNKVLEIGYGNGLLHKELKYYDYTAIEPCKRLCSLAIKNGANAIECFIPPVPENIKDFDAVVAINSFEHFKNYNDIIDVLSKISKNIIIVCPDYVDWKEDFYNSDYTHQYETTLQRFVMIFKDSGIDIKHTEYFRGVFNSLLFYPVDLITRNLFYILFSITKKQLLLKGRYMFHRSFVIIGEKYK